MNTDRALFGAACGLAFGVLGGGVAHADDAGPGAVTVYDYAEGGGAIDIPSILAPGTVRLGQSFVTIETTPGGAVLAHTPVVAPGAYGFEAVGDVTYHAEIVGPAASDIPLRLSFSMFVIGDSMSSISNADVGFFDGAINIIHVYNGSPPVYDTGYVSQGEPTDTPFKIYLDASSLGGGTAYVDPILSLDPDWVLANPALASQVSLSFSGGFDNGLGDLAGVTEPAAWTMMLLGVGLVGGAQRRRRMMRPVAA
jgi:hypothetical protein